MKLIDLTEAYCRHVATRDSWCGYERLYPVLFRHYFRYWARRAYPNIQLSIDNISEQSDRIKRRLSRILRSFQSRGYNTNALSIVLFVGKGCTNGHALLDGNKWVVWIPVETYTTTRLVDVFVTHEIAHALHYAHSPKFYFATKREQRHFSRQLLTEGLATLMTCEVLRCSEEMALWGGYLDQKQLAGWTSACDERWQDLLEYAVRHFDAEAKTELFQANDSADVFKFRAGYLLGLNLIKVILAERNLTTVELLSMRRRELEQIARAKLVHGF